ncbi:MAG: hypothetical protein CRN43_07815 [Candidatus Nephrothrix sp. EaCA]|nr:MAG: hypothetical protein CRN43_07815 [Candidatus Nephrothrix sp. EaCA]
MLYLYTIYARAMGFYDKDMKKWSMNFGKMGRKRKRGAKTENSEENGKKGLIGRFSEKSEKSAGFGKDGSRVLQTISWGLQRVFPPNVPPWRML